MSASKCFGLERAGDTLVVLLGPHIAVLDESELLREREVFLAAVNHPTIRAVVVDFTHAEYFSSVLLDILCQAWKQLRQRDAKMVLCSLPEIAREIITRCRLDMLWPLYPSREAAFRALGTTHGDAPSPADDPG